MVLKVMYNVLYKVHIFVGMHITKVVLSPLSAIIVLGQGS